MLAGFRLPSKPHVHLATHAAGCACASLQKQSACTPNVTSGLSSEFLVQGVAQRV